MSEYRYPVRVRVPAEYIDLFESGLLVLRRDDLIRDWRRVGRVDEDIGVEVDVIPLNIGRYISRVDDLLASIIGTDDIVLMVHMYTSIERIREVARITLRSTLESIGIRFEEIPEVAREKYYNGTAVLVGTNIGAIVSTIRTYDIRTVEEQTTRTTAEVIHLAGALAEVQLLASLHDPDVVLDPFERLAVLSTLVVRIGRVVREGIEPPAGRGEPEIVSCRWLDERGYLPLVDSRYRYVIIDMGRWVRRRLAVPAEVCFNHEEGVYILYVHPDEFVRNVRLRLGELGEVLPLIIRRMYIF